MRKEHVYDQGVKKIFVLVPKVVLRNQNGCKIGEEKWAIMNLRDKGQFSMRADRDSKQSNCHKIIDKRLEGGNQAGENR